MNRWWILTPCVVALAWLVLSDSIGPGAAGQVSAPVERVSSVKPNGGPRAVGKPRADAVVPIRSLISRDQLTEVDGAEGYGLFAPRTWAQPLSSPLNVKAVNEIPAFPYVVVGRKKDGVSWEIFLTRDEHTFVAREGHALENEYMVKKITSSSMKVVLVRLNHVYEIALGDAENE